MGNTQEVEKEYSFDEISAAMSSLAGKEVKERTLYYWMQKLQIRKNNNGLYSENAFAKLEDWVRNKDRVKTFKSFNGHHEPVVSNESKLLDIAQILKNIEHHEEIPSIPLRMKSKLPKVSAVYVVYESESVLYVGQSRELKQRFLFHKTLDAVGKNGCVRVGWIPVDAENLDFAERYLIGLLRPSLNIIHNKKDE